ncbi:MAG: hypothetical protein SOI08_06690 [Bifidobacterium subtile]
MAQALSQRQAILGAFHWQFGHVGKPSLRRRLQVRALIHVRFHAHQLVGLFGARNGVVVCLGIEELADTEAIFSNDRVCVERRVENLGGISANSIRIIVGTHGGGSADAAELTGGSAKPVSEAAEQAGEIGALRSVEGVKLIDDEITQRIGVIAVPKLRVLRPHQQVVEHLVIGKQDVRRIFQQRAMASDDGAFAHPFAFVIPALRLLPNIHACAHVVA